MPEQTRVEFGVFGEDLGGGLDHIGREANGAPLGPLGLDAGQGMEVAILLDTTCSMRDDQAAVNRALDEILSNVEAQDGTVSMASFGDNWGCDDPWYSRNAGGFLDPSSDSALVGDQLMSGMRQTDGCDWPESLYDGVWKTADELPWSASNRLLIAITDAAPLEPPYTNHTASQVVDKLVEREIVLSTILVGVSY